MPTESVHDTLQCKTKVPSSAHELPCSWDMPWYLPLWLVWVIPQ